MYVSNMLGAFSINLQMFSSFFIGCHSDGPLSRLVMRQRERLTKSIKSNAAVETACDRGRNGKRLMFKAEMRAGAVA